MTDPIAIDDATPRFALPLLYAGQAQKEVFVNEALLRADALIHATVLGRNATPPAAPSAGDAWLVAAGATGAWAGKTDCLALFQGGGWTFVTPRDGLRIHDAGAGQQCFFSGIWRKAEPIVEPIGGLVVDGEARAAIADLVSALKSLGVLPPA